MEVLTWRQKGLFGAEMIIVKDRLIIGMLRNSWWSGKAYGEVRGRMLRIHPKGWTRKRFSILDIEGVREIGRIETGWLARKGTIQVNDLTYHFRRTGWLKNCIIIGSEDGDELVVKSSGVFYPKGTIEFDYIDPTLMLVGLYILDLARKRNAAS